MKKTYQITKNDSVHFVKNPKEGMWYYYFAGVTRDGLAYESEDTGGFDSLEEAAEDAVAYLEETAPERAVLLKSALRS